MPCLGVARRHVWLVCQVAGTNFLPQLLAWVDKDNLPDYLGGTSTATLIDDAGPWQDPAFIAEAFPPPAPDLICSFARPPRVLILTVDPGDVDFVALPPLAPQHPSLCCRHSHSLSHRVHVCRPPHHDTRGSGGWRG